MLNYNLYECTIYHDENNIPPHVYYFSNMVFIFNNTNFITTVKCSLQLIVDIHFVKTHYAFDICVY